MNDTMTEDDWLVSRDPELMLDFLGDRASIRKRRLFACGCCRRIWHLLSYESSRTALEVIEQDVDGLLDSEGFAQAVINAETAMQAHEDAEGVSAVTWPQRAAAQAVLQTVQAALADAVRTAAESEAGKAVLLAGNPGTDPHKQWEVARQAARREQAILLRHLIGNPFQPMDDVEPLPSEVRELAAALYEGVDCYLVLRNTLREAGQDDLSDHFRQPGHPRGCWALDRILEKD